MKHPVKFTVNGTPYELSIEPQELLVDVLRNQLDFTGTKKGCGTGECGVCTVIMDGKSVNSCLVLALEAEGKEILTIEGLGERDQLHPIQEAFVNRGAVQCGFCTPGMVLSAKALLDENPRPTEEEIKLAIAGNICRCTGYRKIVEAIQEASRNLRTKHRKGGDVTAQVDPQAKGR
jgi:carbon-monoxide dehydrogenase small subunit